MIDYYGLIIFLIKTVNYIGDAPTYQELLNMENDYQRKYEVRGLICPCEEGNIGSLCSNQVKRYLQQYRHSNLCRSFQDNLNYH